MMLVVKYLLQAAYLIFILISLSYLTGMLWWVYCELLHSGFNSEFEIENKTKKERIIIMAYFMFTSLSTVGLGDYHPTSDAERILGALILLFGVLVTSFVMENFIFMIKQIRTVGDSFE